MSVEFLDEVEPAQTTGVEFLGESEPATAEDIEGRMADLRYDPTPAEFSIWKKAKDEESWFQPRRWANTAVEAAGALAGTAVEAAKEVPQAIMHPGDLVQTILEAGGRGVLRDADMVAKIGANLRDLVTPGHPNQLVLEDYLKMKQQDLEREQYPDGFIRGRTDIPLPAVPADTQARWTREYYDQYIPKVAYENFLNNRESLRRAAAVAAGQENFFPPITGEVRNQLAEAMSLVASPASVAGFGMGASARAGEASLVARSAAAAANVAGKTASKVGRGFEYLGELPGRVAADVAEAVTGSAEAAERARRIVEGGSLAATVVSPALTVPGLSQVAIASQGALRGGQALNAAGEVLQAGARAVTDPVLRKQGLLWNMARDAEAPLWLRNAANAARGLDPALGVAGHLAEGAVAGAAFGGALGLAADGPEGAAGGIGSGAVLGAGFSAVGRLAGGKGIRMAAEDRDLAQWLATKGEAELANIRAHNMTREQAIATMETEVIARGMLEGGDIHLEFLNGEQMQARTGDTSRGAQYVQGDRPVILINTDYQGPRTLFHELGHALSSLTGLDPQKQQLARVLFTQSTPDGVEISRGIYSPEDLAAFEKQYVDRLSPAQRSGWESMPAEERQARIQGEVIAESFANMLSGSSTGPLGKGVNGLRRRVADAMLLSEQTSMLGRMRRALEAVGVEFSASGEPSELFVKDGRPVTNHPRVDAAVRDYLRAKNSVVRRLLANDAEAVNATITPFDFQKAGNEGLVAAYADWDGFARNPDGSVRMQNGTPVLMTEREIAQLQANRVEQMINALRTVPDSGEVGLMREQENGAWRGRRLSEAQLKAIEALPNNILSPGMKAKIRALNELAQQPGNQILIDYNAALKGRRYSSGISATTRMLVPLTFNISKAGNFFMETLDTSHFRRKLGVWEKKKNAFDLWGGDTAAFMRDVFRYLENHQNDRPGSVNLDPDPVRAVEKKTAIHEFFNFQGSNARETMLRSRRLDRINRIAPGAGSTFPIDYYKIKANFLPGGSRPTTRRGGRDVEEHIRAQTLANFADRFPGVPAPAAVRIGERLMRELDRTLPRRGNENSLARAERIARLVTRTDASAKQAIAEAMVRGGMKAAEEAVRTVALRESVRDVLPATPSRRAEITLSPADQRHMDWVSQTAARASGNRGIDVYWDPTERIGGAIVEAKYVDGRLQLNAATLRSHQQILGAVREELGHQALATPRGQKLLEEFMGGHGLSQAQRQALAEAGYQPFEGESAKGYSARLHDEFVAKAGRIGWFRDMADRLVATVKRALGLSLTQEQAARAILRELRKTAAGVANQSELGKAQLRPGATPTATGIVIPPKTVVKLPDSYLHGSASERFGLDMVPIGADPSVRFSLRKSKYKPADIMTDESAWAIVNRRLAAELEVTERLLGVMGEEAGYAVHALTNRKGEGIRVMLPQDLSAMVYKNRETFRKLMDAPTLLEAAQVNKLLSPAEAHQLKGVLGDDSGINMTTVKKANQALNQAGQPELSTRQLHGLVDLYVLRNDTSPLLGDNGKVGASTNLALLTCSPTEGCAECYAAKQMSRPDQARKALHDTILLYLKPEEYGRRIAEEAKRYPKTELPFIRLHGSGEMNSSEHVKAFNEMAKTADRPIHVFSRRHDLLAQLQGTPQAPFLKMGSIDGQLVDAYGMDYLKANFRERGIANAYLYSDPADLPKLKALADAKALDLILAAKHELHDALPPELKMRSCPCDAGERSFLASCRQCAMSNEGCFMAFADKGIDGQGKIWNLIDVKRPEVEPMTAFVPTKDGIRAWQSIARDVLVESRNKIVRAKIGNLTKFMADVQTNVRLKDLRRTDSLIYGVKQSEDGGWVVTAEVGTQDYGKNPSSVVGRFDSRAAAKAFVKDKAMSYIAFLNTLIAKSKEGTFWTSGGPVQEGYLQKGVVYEGAKAVSGPEALAVKRREIGAFEAGPGVRY